MKTEDNKQLSVETLINITKEQEVPPLYKTREIDGIIVKEYNFIQEHPAIVNSKDSIPEININSKDFNLLAARKNEIESQIELHHKHCYRNYFEIKNIRTPIWLYGKFEYFDLDEITEAEKEKLYHFISGIKILIYCIMVGDEMKTFLDMNKDDYPSLELRCSKWHKKTARFDLFEYAEAIKRPADEIHRIVTRTTSLYLEYLKIQSVLYSINIEKLINTLSKDDIYSKILNAPEGQRARKITLVEYFYRNEDCHTYPKAFDEANKVHREIAGKPIYSGKDGFKSFESSKSVFMKEQEGQKILKEILNRIK